MLFGMRIHKIEECFTVQSQTIQICSEERPLSAYCNAKEKNGWVLKKVLIFYHEYISLVYNLYPEPSFLFPNPISSPILIPPLPQALSHSRAHVSSPREQLSSSQGD